MELLIQGLAAMLTAQNILFVFFGTALGIIFGAIPGLTATMAVVLCLPLTFGMNPLSGMALLIGLYIGGISGGLISAILLNIPGTPSSIATTFDGHPMAKRGEAGKALGVGIVSSFFGGFFSILVLILISPLLASVALKFTSFEYFSLAVFAISMVAGMSEKNLEKGILSGVFGMLFAVVGSAPIDGTARFTFGNYNLQAGFQLVPVLIGMYALTEVIDAAGVQDSVEKNQIRDYSIKGFGFRWAEFFKQKWNLLRSSVIGTLIGIMPGVGPGLSNIVSYLAAKNNSKYPEKFGTGIMDGIIASEAANNASIGGAMVPLITLGIPGDATTALLLGALTLHGLRPGPLLISTNPQIVYGIFGALIIANIFMLVIEYFGMRVFTRLLVIRKQYLLPVVVALCVIGCIGINNRVFDAITIFIFSIVGYLFKKFDFPITPMVLGFILGPMAEENLRRALMFSQGSFAPFVTRPISACFLLVSVIVVVLAVRKSLKSDAAKN